MQGQQSVVPTSAKLSEQTRAGKKAKEEKASAPIRKRLLLVRYLADVPCFHSVHFSLPQFLIFFSAGAPITPKNRIGYYKRENISQGKRYSAACKNPDSSYQNEHRDNASP